MPQRLLLEGSDIDALLERVRLEHGPDARIVHAEQKLVGGVGGFFAKRRFEVAVALDDAPSGPASIDDLLALADAQDGAAPREDEPVAAAAPEALTLPAPEPSEAVAAMRSPGRQVSTENASFDHFVRELIAQAEGGPLHSEPASFVPATVRVETAAPPSTPAAPGAAVAPAAPAAPAAPSATPSPAPIVPGPATQPADGAQPQHADPRLALLDRLGEVAVSPPRTLTGTQVVVGPWAPAMAVARAWAAECGEDDAVVDTLADADALTGTAHGASVDEALRRRPDRGRVVVVATDGTSADARRAGRRVAALGADAVTALVDARWDVATSRRGLDALRDGGARIDRLAAHGVHDAADPLRLLDLAVPVTWLDARPATLGTWAAPCLDRL